MEKKEKLTKLEELLDLEENVLSEDCLLEDLDEWDSIAHLSLLIMIEEEFGKKITGAEIRGLKTVNDILNIMG